MYYENLAGRHTNTHSPMLTHTLASVHIHLRENFQLLSNLNQTNVWKYNIKSDKGCDKGFDLPQGGTHGDWPLLGPLTCRRRWLYLPSPVPLWVSHSALFPSCSALPYCSVSFIFPTSLLSLPSFFSLCLFPFSLPPPHYVTDSLSPSVSICALVLRW